MAEDVAFGPFNLGRSRAEVEAIVDEFWDYDEADRAKATEISHHYLQSKQTTTKDHLR